MKQTIPLLLLLTIFFSACTNSQVGISTNVPMSTPPPNMSAQTPTPDGLAIRSTERVGTVVALQTAEIPPLAIESTITPIPTLLGNYDSEVTWHPQDILLSISESANDGNPWIAKWPLLRLYWDGTLIRGNIDTVAVTQLSRPQMCKLLNSIQQVGWFNVSPVAYRPNFAGTWAENIGIHSWQERDGGGYLFTSALKGDGAREPFFCGDCIKTKPQNFITAAEANTYYLIYNNLPTDFKLEDNFQEPSAVPNDYQITCKASDGVYPSVLVDQEAKYVIFSGTGRRAIGILNQNSPNVQSVVYESDGSKQSFSYDPKSFGADTLTIIPRLWAKDNQYVYLSVYPNDVNIQSFHEAIALQQIDTNTGQTQYLFQGQANDFYSYELSNTGSRLAYIKQDQSPFELVILDLATGKELKLKLESSDIPANQFTMAGGLQFNFELDKLFFSAVSDQLTASSNCDAPLDAEAQKGPCTIQSSPTTTFFMVDLLNPSKLYVIYQRPGTYKIQDVRYSNNYPKRIDICSISDKHNGDECYNYEIVNLP
ncbi:MAG: hypothetical protein ABI904_16620 [Chloroflexota bacterium]